jgi:hypothetical protein
VGGNDEEVPFTCRIQPETKSCVCTREEGGDKTSCTPADVSSGACFGEGDYCICRPWTCGGTAQHCSCEFQGVHAGQDCTGTQCCFEPDQSGGFCACRQTAKPCAGQLVSDCNFATIEPFLAKTDGTYPRVDACPP